MPYTESPLRTQVPFHENEHRTVSCALCLKWMAREVPLERVPLASADVTSIPPVPSQESPSWPRMALQRSATRGAKLFSTCRRMLAENVTTTGGADTTQDASQSYDANESNDGEEDSSQGGRRREVSGLSGAQHRETAQQVEGQQQAVAAEQHTVLEGKSFKQEQELDKAPKLPSRGHRRLERLRSWRKSFTRKKAAIHI